MEIDVIIVSKTHMHNNTCVGGILANGRFVRLLNSRGYNQPEDTSLQVLQVYRINFENRQHLTPPHIEDILVSNFTFKFSFRNEEKMIDYITNRLDVNVWEGGPDILFNGCLQWTENGSGYISEHGDIPSNSVGFWKPDKDLNKRVFYDKVRYNYPNTNGWRSLPFVGFADPVEIIPAGTLVRVSLARWWDRSGQTEKRCSLQLSGWYNVSEASITRGEENIDQDLPF